MFAPQDEIRVQLPQEMRGVVEKLMSSGLSLGTVSALELFRGAALPNKPTCRRVRGCLQLRWRGPARWRHLFATSNSR